MSWDKYCSSFKDKLCSLYLHRTGRVLHIDNPCTFTEKLQWLKLYDCTYMKSLCADKRLLHLVSLNELGEDICIPTLKVYASASEIDFRSLPDSFVLKCNHGCGYNIVVKDKKDLNIPDVVSRVAKWLSCSYGNYGIELHYNLIQPCILIEPYISDLLDIKVFCFNGVVKFIQVDRHFTDNRLNFYDVDWKPLEWLSNSNAPADYSVLDEKPTNLSKMLTIAEKLSMPFKFVRVDLYSSSKGIFLGELTFTPGAGFQSYRGDGDLRIGKMLDI